jgi:hypothetical protein
MPTYKRQEQGASEKGLGLKLLTIMFLLCGALSLGCTTSDSRASKPVGDTSSPSPSPSPSPEVVTAINSPEIQARVLRGKQLFEKLKPQIPGVDRNPELYGQLTASPTLAFYLTNDQWKKLRKEQQVDLTWYFESFISPAKSDPEKYAGISRAAPFYPRAVQITRDLCADCWSVILGSPTVSGGKKTITIDRIIVQGDSSWEKRDSYDRSMKASEFRK